MAITVDIRDRLTEVAKASLYGAVLIDATHVDEDSNEEHWIILCFIDHNVRREFLTNHVVLSKKDDESMVIWGSYGMTDIIKAVENYKERTDKRR